MYLIDTNIHAAYLLQFYEDDEITKRYLEVYETIALADRVVPDFILSEFETFIMHVVPSRYQLKGEDKQKLKQLVLAYINSLTHECTMAALKVETLRRARDIYFENVNSNYLSFADCLVLASAEQNEYTLFTKDERMKLTAKQLNIALLEPQE